MKKEPAASAKADPSPLWGPHRLAWFLDVKVGTVFSWVSRKVDLPPFVTIGRSTRWKPEDVIRWVDERKATKRKRDFEE